MTAAASRYPLRLFDERPLPDDYDGPIHVWDVDKTYLDTDLSTVRGLLRIPLEMAIDKRTIPGAVAVLRECRRGTGRQPRNVPLYFVSASPPQLAGVIRRRMLIDGVEPDGFVFKDQLALALRGRIHQLRTQVEYKLSALWSLIVRFPPRARLVLVGDDWESDALVFARLAAAQGGALAEAALANVLRGAGVENVAGLLDLARPARDRARVELACVLLTRGRDPGTFDDFGPTVRAARDALQLAAVLLSARLIAVEGVGRIARHLVDAWSWRRQTVAASIDDLASRRLVDGAVLDAVRAAVG
jgi:hypothetical protein